MTPQEKAEELVEKYSELYDYGSLAKDSALIAVDDIISSLQNQINKVDNIDIIYWEKVKQELIKKL